MALCALAVACSGGGDEQAAPDLRGEHVEVLAVWQDAEAESFRAVLDGFEAATGARVTFTSTEGEDVADVLDPRLESGSPPDVAILPQPALIERYAAAGRLVPIDDVVGEQVTSSWPAVWRRLGTVDGELYGLWFKAANKSLVWYSLGAFEAAGVVPPQDLEGLGSVARSVAATGMPAFSLTGEPSDAWTLTDWFENLYLRQAGPERYDDLAAHRIPWTHPTVRDALRTMVELLSPEGMAARDAGPATTFPESVAAVFSPRPRAAMVVEGDFVPGVVAGVTEADVGVDVDVFPIPGLTPSDRYVVGAGDAAVLLRPSRAAEALLAHLASTDAAATWAARGGFVSPNEALDLGAYRDPTTRRIARALLEAGDGFRFDLSDLQPVAFGGTTGEGMWSALTDLVEGRADVDGTMARLEAAAAEAWSGR